MELKYIKFKERSSKELLSFDIEDTMQEKFRQLKSCTTLEEIYIECGEKWISIAIYWSSLILCFMPIIAMTYYVKKYIKDGIYWINQDNLWRDYGTLAYVVGFLILILFGLLLLRQWTLTYESKWKNLRTAVKANPWNLAFFFMLLWACMATAFSNQPFVSLIGNEYRFEGLLMYVIYMGIYGCGLFLKDDRKKSRIFWLYAWTATIMCLVMLAQEWNWLGLREIFFGRGTAVFFNSNHFGYFLNMSVLALCGLFLYEKRRLQKMVLILLLMFQIYVMIINDTFGCYLAMSVAAIVLAVFAAKKQKKFSMKFLIPFLLIVLISATNYAGVLPKGHGKDVGQNLDTLLWDIEQVADRTNEMEHAGSSRMGLWIASGEMIAQKPILGYGPDSAEVDEIQNFQYWRPHNEYLQHALYLGIPGLLFYLVGLVLICRNRWKKLSDLSEMQVVAGGCVMTYLISACFGNTMFYTTPYFWMFLAFLL